MTPEQKQELVSATHRHLQLDSLVKGTYGEFDDESPFKGCSVGCLAADFGVYDDHHAFVAKQYGYPEWLVHLQDYFFEQLGNKVHTEIAESINPNNDWLQVMHAIHWRILTEIALPNAGSAKEVVQAVADLHRANEPARSAAWSAAWSAARSVAEPAARSAAWSATAARSAAATWSATWSAARSAAAAESAAESAAYQIVLDEIS